MLLAVLIYPYHRALVGRKQRHLVHHVDGIVEIVGYVQLIIFIEVLEVIKIRAHIALKQSHGYSS